MQFLKQEDITMKKLLQFLPRKSRIIAEVLVDGLTNNDLSRNQRVGLFDGNFDTVVAGFNNYYIMKSGKIVHRNKIIDLQKDL